MKHLFPLLLLLTSTAHAATLGVHVASVHSKENDVMNNDNRGAYVQSGDWVVGGYRNSLHRNTFYGGYVAEAGPFAVTVGAASGYQRKHGVGHTKGAIGPLLAFSVRTPEFMGVRARLNIVPASLVKSADVLNLSMEY